jgi:rubrerythrin
MPSLKGTQTEKNLLTAFAGESQARNRYTFYSGIAKKEGYEQVAEIFLETAENEKEHAKRFFRFLEGGNLEITGTFPSGTLNGDTLANLEAAANGEHEEWSDIYKAAAEMATKEGFADIAAAFLSIAKVEQHHERRYRGLAFNLRDGKVFKKDSVVTWKCRNCGFTHESKFAPERCPACLHPQNYFEVLAENY